MNIFYQPDIELTETLSDEESQHAIRVLRHQKGDEIFIVDGLGVLYTAKITDAHPHKCRVEIIGSQSDFGAHPYYLHIAVAPTKNIDRFEWFVEKATEIGVDRITPILCRYSERKQINIERLNKIIISAGKQSLKARFPILDPLTPIEEIINSQSDCLKLIAHCSDGEKNHIFNTITSNKILALIGPEGDFSEQEISTALNSGFQPISLGESRLRTETAAVMATASVNIHFSTCTR